MHFPKGGLFCLFFFLSPNILLFYIKKIFAIFSLFSALFRTVNQYI